MSETTLTFPGTFRARPLRFAWRESATSQAKGVDILFQCLAFRGRLRDSDTGPWTECEDESLFCEGTVWLVRRTGSVDAARVESLMRATGWDGELDSLLQAPMTWEPTECEIVVASEEYKGQKQLKVQWVNPLGGRQGVSDGALSSIKAQFGGQFRAIAGNVTRNTPKPLPSQTPIPVDKVPF